MLDMVVGQGDQPEKEGGSIENIVIGGPLFGLDLDVCVPQWMRDNFAQGIYPTLEERGAFVADACEYVDLELAKRRGSDSACVVSFSFVNEDLRAAWRAHFPQAAWCLVDTSAASADIRIAQREGHFYNVEGAGADPTAASKIVSVAEPAAGAEVEGGGGLAVDEDNSEWDFAPVTHPHHVLDGEAPVHANARAALKLLHQAATDAGFWGSGAAGSSGGLK